MRITRTAVARTCAICERSLLMGERVVRFAPHAGADLVDVCALCQDEALESGWLKEGAPTTPLVADDRRRRSALDLRSIFGGRRAAGRAGRVGADPAPPLRRGARRWSRRPSCSTRASSGARSAASRRASASRRRRSSTLSGVNAELVVTVAWDISWYQYRVTPDSAQPVRLEERGHELDELDERYTQWNAHVEDGGRLVPDIARI